MGQSLGIPIPLIFPIFLRFRGRCQTLERRLFFKTFFREHGVGAWDFHSRFRLSHRKDGKEAEVGDGAQAARAGPS